MFYCFAPRCSHSSESHTYKFFAFPSDKKEKGQYKRWIRLIRFVLSFLLKEHHKIWNAEVILTKCLMNNRMQCLPYGYWVTVFLHLLFLAFWTLTKQKVWEWYGKSWAIYGPYVEIIWEGWWPYGIDMGPDFCKFQAMESIWEEKLMLCVIWESYGDRMPIEIPYHWHICLPHALHGIDMGCPHLKIPYVIHTSWQQFFQLHRISIWLVTWDFYGTKGYHWNWCP